MVDIRMHALAAAGALILSGCAVVAPSPIGPDHPADPAAAAAPLDPAPSALSGYKPAAAFASSPPGMDSGASAHDHDPTKEEQK
ncbi:MAG TPA: hypothetical protein VFB20_17210 [Burkholderiales bacterium]|nr:hypothetical protein [Burkholderiales bacterium]